MVCLTLPENGFNFVSENFGKTKKGTFETLTTFFFELQIASKPFSKKLVLIKL